jgi:hypothetical protein
VTRRVNVEGWIGSVRPNKRWIECVRHDMREMDVSYKMTTDRGERKNTSAGIRAGTITIQTVCLDL